MGVPVTGTITTTGPGDTYATTDPLTGIDSWRSVADQTELNAITTLRRREGMAAWVRADNNGAGQLYTLDPSPWGGTITDWTAQSFSGGGGGGTVNSVAMTGDGVVFNATVNGSPVTNTGTLIPALLIHNSNLVLAGPVNGNAAAPTFRLLNAADIPALAYGVVNSVGMVGDGVVFNAAITNSPITGTGTLTPVLLTHNANLILAGPVTGNAAAPTFRLLNAADLPSAGGTTTGVVSAGAGLIATNGVISLNSIATLTLLANVTNSSAVPSSTTASALLDAAIASTQGDILYRGASAWSALTPGTSGQVLAAGGASANPSWASTGLVIAQHTSGPLFTHANTNGTVTLDLSQNDWIKVGPVGGNFTLAVANATNGQQFAVILAQQAGNGNFGVTWFNGVTWVGAPYTAPSMPTTNGAVLTATFKTTGTNTYLGWWLGNSAT